MLGEMAGSDETSLVRTRPARPALGHLLEAARQRAFVGRAAELAAFRAALADDAASAVLFVHGAGGTGKTTLLRRFAAEAESRGRRVMRPGHLGAAPTRGASSAGLPAAGLADFEAKLAAILTSPSDGGETADDGTPPDGHSPPAADRPSADGGAPPDGRRRPAADRPSAADDAPCAGETPPAVLLVDDLDDWSGAEPWLREVLLPGLPVGTVVVLAGRTPPGPEWTTDPGWREVLGVHRLGDLAPEEARLLLERRSVPRDQHAALLAVGDGNPLALLVAADALADGGSIDDVRLAVAHAVLDRVIGPTPTPAHRRALEICAANQPATEAALAAEGDATELFRWLRALPFVDQSPDGLRLRPFVREAIRTERRWRNPATEPDGGAPPGPVDGGVSPRPGDGSAALTPSATLGTVADGVVLAAAGGASPRPPDGGAAPGAVGGAPTRAPGDGPRPLAREAFERGVREALRSWRRPDLLARNPLVRSRLVAARPERDRVSALRAALQAALDEMSQDPREAKRHRALLATYLGGAPTQEAAAERLGLPFSTYRRHLGQGLSVLVSLLWWQESRGDQPGG